MLIQTGIRYNHRRVYRLIGRDLYSTRTNISLSQQEYVIEKVNIIDENQSQRQWRVVIRDGMVYLEI